MSISKLSPMSGLVIAAMASVSPEASASAQMGPYDVPPLTYPTFAACRSVLEDQYKSALEGLRSANPSTDSDWTNSFFDSKGVVDKSGDCRDEEAVGVLHMARVSRKCLAGPAVVLTASAARVMDSGCRLLDIEQHEA